MRGDPWSEKEQQALREIVAQLEHLDEITGGWTSKLDARLTGFSLHIKFEKKLGITDALSAAAMFEHGPEKLMQIVARTVGQLDAASEVPA